jgi:hypothetical protein
MSVARQRTVRTLTCAACLAVAGGLFGLPGPFAAGQAMAACTGPGAPTTTETKCVTGIAIPGNPLRSFDISWVNPDRGEYYLGDRSNAGIDVVDTHKLKWKRTLGGFVGIVLNGSGAVDNNHSGPDGVVSHGRWVYGGDGDSTLKVFDLDAPPMAALQQSISTGGTTRVDEMALTTDGGLLLAANNAEDPPFGTLFAANGDDEDNDNDHDGHHAKSHVKIITKVTVDPTIIPPGFGLSIEQPAWDPKTKRFLVSVPVIANNPSGCNYGQMTGTPTPPITCDGGVIVINPLTLSKPTATVGAFDAATNTGVVALHKCGPNGASVGPDDNVLLGCTPQNNPSDVITLAINAQTKAQTPIANITGSDEVWYNSGDGRYYTGSSRDCTVPGSPCPKTSQQTPVLGVIDAEANSLIEKVPQSSGSHSVAADSELNRIFVPQVAPVAIVGTGGDTTTVGAGICGTNNGCIAVYHHGDGDHDHDDHEADAGH